MDLEHALVESGDLVVGVRDRERHRLDELGALEGFAPDAARGRICAGVRGSRCDLGLGG